MPVGERLDMEPGVEVMIRPVLPGDEWGLTAVEVASLAGSVVLVHRRAGAARMAARALLAEFGHPGFSLARLAGRGPEWPCGLIGSLSHAQDWAAAAVAPCGVRLSVGIDIEPREPLDDNVLALIATPEEAGVVGSDLLAGRSLWCAKEAAYKAMFALDKRFLEPRQVAVDLAGRTACSDYGRSVRLSIVVNPRIIVALSTI